jgi:hypothetical protein
MSTPEKDSAGAAPEPELLKEKKPGADDFFKSSSTDREDQLGGFIAHMKTPREQMDLPGDDGNDPLKENDEDGDDWSAEDEDMMNHFDYTPEHKYLAEFFLVQIDKAVAFSLSIISGAETDRYRRRLKKPSGEDYEAEILAALLKKYQMRMSLEWMFVSAMVIAYSPMVDMALKDRRTIMQARAREQANQEQAERARETRSSRKPSAPSPITDSKE